MEDIIIYSKDGKKVIGMKDDSVMNIIIPRGVEVIEGYAFAGNDIVSVEISDSVVRIDPKAFQKCTNLQSIKVAPNNPKYTSIDGVLYSKDKKNIIRVPQKVEKFAIPESVTVIGEDAFWNCRDLTSVDLPISVRHIKSGAFFACEKLKDVKIPEYLLEIGQKAFCGCKNLTIINIPRYVRQIHYKAFSGCTALKEIQIAHGVKSICFLAFSDCTSLKKVDIPTSISTIDSCAFENCTSLEEVHLPSSNIIIFNKSFAKCLALNTVTFGACWDYDKTIKRMMEELEDTQFLTSVNEATSSKHYDYTYDDYDYENGESSQNSEMCDDKEWMVYLDELDKILDSMEEWEVDNDYVDERESYYDYVDNRFDYFDDEEFVPLVIKENAFLGAENIQELHLCVDNPHDVLVEDSYENIGEIVLYVPENSVGLYRKHPYWSQFKEIKIEELTW